MELYWYGHVHILYRVPLILQVFTKISLISLTTTDFGKMAKGTRYVFTWISSELFRKLQKYVEKA